MAADPLTPEARAITMSGGKIALKTTKAESDIVNTAYDGE
jgi:hypothetical protein